MNEVKKQERPFDTTFPWNTNLDKVKSELSKVSSSYCLSKWAHSTIHFQLGTTHSCYNLPTHKIPTDQLETNPSSLHNTPTKIEQRQLMRQGLRPPECAYCWNIEDLNSQNHSDRIIQSAGVWAYPEANEVYASGLGENFNPRYLEVSFSNVCNFKCSYCNPRHSSSWAEEIKTHGPYVLGFKQETPDTISEDKNPYIKAFKTWWPTLKKDLKVFRITGGEPLLSTNTWQILDDLQADPVPHLHLSINSNLGVSDKTIDKLINKLQILISNKSVSRVTIFTSIESMGEQAEYIRHGLNAEKFFNNIEKILAALPEVRISIMATFCVLSIFNYQDLVKKVIELRQKYTTDEQVLRLGLSTNYLRFPEYLSAQILPTSVMPILDEIYNFMQSHEFHIENYKIGFTRQEISMFDNLRQWIARSIDLNLKHKLRQQMIEFFAEHDRRRGTNLAQTFPELNDLLFKSND